MNEIVDAVQVTKIKLANEMQFYENKTKYV